MNKRTWGCGCGIFAVLTLVIVISCRLLWYTTAESVTLWEIPYDFRGWAVLEWENPHCAPLPSRGLKRIVVIDATGNACTSDRQEDVPSATEMWLVWPHGQHQELKEQDFGYAGLQAYYGGTASGDNILHPFSHQFIGTEAERVGANYAVVRPRCGTPGPIRNQCIP
jgi:hypothetical protein